MSIAASCSRSGHRPVAVWAIICVLVFLGVSATGGGAALLTDIGGAAPPPAWLEGVPLVDSWIIPGLVLGVGFGIGSLFTAYGMLSRRSFSWARPVEYLLGRHWCWAATLLIGLGQVAWIGLEVAYLPELSVLQPVYGSVGFALLLLPLLPSVREYLSMSGTSV